MTPPPMTPPDCDLRGYDYMPLLGHRLFNSEFNARASDAEFRAAVQLWWAAWNQVPAASLPDDDVVLAMLAGFARDVKAWRKVREMALNGFEKCSDGRLYHNVIAPHAVIAYDMRLRSSAKRETDRQRLHKWRDTRRGTPEETRGNSDETNIETPHETPHETSFKTVSECVSSVVEEKRREEKRSKKKTPLPPKGDALAAPLPDWMPLRAWNDFMDARKQMRKPVTPAAYAGLIRQFIGWRARGIDIEAALDASTANGWQGVFEPKAPPLRVVQGGRTSASEAADYLASLFTPPETDLNYKTVDGEIA